MTAGGAPTRWLVVSVTLPAPDAEDAVADRLLALGGRAVVVEGDRLVTHLPEPSDPDAVARELREGLTEVPGAAGAEIDLEWRPHRDWAEVWKRGLGPRRITPRLVVSPSWCHPDPGPGDIVVVVDPGMAFGTAEHGTTRGCLRLLDAVVSPGDRVLDVGAGSAILSIVAARLGAADVLALEGDPWAVEPARENVAANGVEVVVEVRAEWVDAGGVAVRGPRDGIVANIDTGVLRELLPGFRAAVVPGGWLVLGGIPDHEWEAMVRDAAELGFGLEAVDADGEWRSGLFRRS